MTTFLSELRVPLAEHFHSLQGEGAYVGLPMHFLRFPGCSVGRLQMSERERGPERVSPLSVLPNGAPSKVCTDFSGTSFYCDTDYDKHGEEPLFRLVAETYETVVNYTGGEPLVHQGTEWYGALHGAFRAAGLGIHIETSGTILPEHQYDCLTVSPKKGWRYDVIPLASQIKFLVTEQTDLNLLDEIAECANTKCQFFLSPVFDPNELVKENLDRCVNLLQHRYRNWRLSVQVHKWLQLR